MTFTKYQCWKTERIGRVVAKAALDIDRTTFLATHVPMRDIVYEKSPLEIQNTSEQKLLAELERMTQEDMHVFTVVKGIPGTGKSHLIRWLFERYKQNHHQDRVLLIERANASLRKTIQQIIDSGVFQSSKLNEQLNQLRNASNILSSEGLADTLLNNLQVATSEVTWHEKLHHRIVPEKISVFLLDQTVREHFKQADGPIERVVKYLQEGRGIRNDEIPGFKPEDLIFDPQQRGKIRQEGYRNVQEVADDISRDNSKQRVQLTRYLNFLLTHYAISRTTNLTASDLREMFNDLRQHLRQQGQSLALFIEDITAFTGIDAGLIDVLITQHTGGDNQAFCRLTSVIGITDAYYSDNIPDNVRERITHQLTLSAQTGLGESDMLRDERTLIEFAARYLNAIRLDANTLEEWEKRGALENSLPNACLSCQYRDTCHSAFGSADIVEDANHSNQVGLYPFNETALVRMYRNLDDKFSRTPRSLLDNILSYILQSHGEKVAAGRFPPPSQNLAPTVNIQEFEPTAHGRIVEQEGGQDADRLKTLLLYWGNRSVYQKNETVGGLSPKVYEAFSLPKISGRSDKPDSIDTPVVIPDQNNVPRSTSIDSQTSTETTSVKPPVQSSVEVKSHSEYLDDISRWASEGYLPSQVANLLLQWLAELFRTGIDWESYGVSPNSFPIPSQASRYFAIEGQSARIEQNRLVFNRSSSLRYALEAIANLNDREIELNSSQYGEHLVAIESWLQQEEKRIVDFIRLRAKVDVPDNLLGQLLIQNAVLLTCLSGDLKANLSIENLYQQVISSSHGTSDVQESKWQKIISDNNLPISWQQLVKDLLRNRAAPMMLQATLEYFNAPQGDSREVLFLHASSVFRSLVEFENRKWELLELPENLDKELGHQEWDNAIFINRKLKGKNGFNKVIEDVYAELQKHFQRLKEFVGDHELKPLFNIIDDLLRNINNIHAIDPSLAYELKRLDADSLDHLLKMSEQALTYQSLNEQAQFISKGYREIVIPLRKYADYFERFTTEMRKVQSALQANRASLVETEKAEELIKTTTEIYDSTLMELDLSSQKDDTDAS